MCSLDLEFQLPDEAKLSVDALVSDDSLPVAANIEPRHHQGSYLSLSDVSDHSIPNSVLLQGQSQRSQVTLATPHVPSLGSAYDPVLSSKTLFKSSTLNQDVDLRTKAYAAKDYSPAAMLGPWSASTKGSILQEKDFPALGAPKTNEVITTNASSVSSKAVMLKAIPVARKQNEDFLENLQEDQGDDSNTDEGQSAKGSETKSLAYITQNSGPTQSREEIAKSDELAEVSRFPPLPTPSAIGSGTTTASRGMPKTLRVIPSSIKMETRSASPSPVPISSVIPATGKPVHPHRPDTPASEMISDTASITSASVSISRAGSPPLSKIGTAPVRGTTKSQQRKQRKDVLKQETKILAEAPKTETTEHAPVIGRKKKQKKEKPPKEANVVSSAAIPIEPPKEETLSHSKSNGKQLDNDSYQRDLKTDGTIYTHSSGPQSSRPNSRSLEKEVHETSASLPTSSPPRTAESVDKALERPQSSPASVFADIKESLWTAALDKLQLLKPVSSNSSRPEHNPSNPLSKRDDCKECSCRCGEMQDADLAALRAGRPVRKQFHTDGSRMLITPHGDCIRGLTPEEEDTFLGLQTAIAATAENPAAFVAPRHQPSSGAFSLIKGRAVPNGRPNIFPSTVQPQSQDPIGKLQREDALSYINQYVLPRLSLGATSMGFPKGASSTRDSASLNSLAPYFYGPDAAAGVGIYSTPESARAIQDFAAPGMSLDEIGKGAAASSIGNMPLMNVEDAEAALIAAKRETEKLEKGLNLVIKRNRRLLLGA
jgi:CCR4-NOT transcription complex subunit 4